MTEMISLLNHGKKYTPELRTEIPQLAHTYI